MKGEAGGTTRFGVMATALKKLSYSYLMLTPPYVALLCRTFVTLEGLLADDPEMAAEFNIYEAALPYAISRVLSPRTRRGQETLRATLLQDRKSLFSSLFREHGGSGRKFKWKRSARVNWKALGDLLASSESDGVAAKPASSGSSDGDFGASKGVQRRLLRTTEGAALRRFLYDLDIFKELDRFLLSRDARPLRHKVIDDLAARLARDGSLHRSSNKEARKDWGPRSGAASDDWGEWQEDDPYFIPQALMKTSKQAWRVVLWHQLQKSLWPPWRLPYRGTVGTAKLLGASIVLGFRVMIKARKPKRTKAVATPAAEPGGPRL